MCRASRLLWPQLIWLGLLGLLPLTGQGLEADRRQPIHIKADRISVDEKQGYSRYRGNVRLQQGSLRVAADEITVYLVKDRLDKIVVIGNPATLEQQADRTRSWIRSRARRMEYHAARDRFYLFDNAEVVQGPNRFAGDYIEYDTRTSTVSARKGEGAKSRVEITITPGTDAAPAGEESKP
jgi:lipopolysaccharide export system protein LptA